MSPCNNFSDAELECYLDEALPSDATARVEQALRDDAELSQRLASINGRRDAGVHSLGAIWRRHRLSCPSREQLGSLLLGVLSKDETAYVSFHIEQGGCRYCQANLADLEAQQAAADDHVQQRRRRYFQSSAGLLHKQD
jgi:anti-sigma factor RsiW